MEVTVAIVTSLLIFLKWITYPYFWLIRLFNRKKLPILQDDLLRLSATTLAELIRIRKISSEQVIKSYIYRIKEVNPILNAVVEDRFDEAINEAKAVDQFLSETDIDEEQLKYEKPLLGVPLTVKESCCVKGLSASVGSLRYKGKKGEKDGEVVAKLRNAGAIPLLVSNTPEMCMGWETSNHITGKTYNPYNPAYSSSGSSGGEAALVSSAASVIGLGSDLAGSIRLPSHFNGVFGHKPTSRVCSIEGHIPHSPDEAYSTLFTLGPITRFAEDLYLMMNVIAEDPAKLKLNEKVDFSTLRIYCVEKMGKGLLQAKVDREIRDLLKKSVKYFTETCQAKFCTKQFQNLDKCLDIGLVILPESTNNILSLTVNPETGKKDLNSNLEVFKASLHLSILTFNAAMSEMIRSNNGFIPKRKREYYRKKCAELKEEMIKELGDDGILFIPTFPSTAFQNGQSALDPRGYTFTLLFNILGFPATHVPMGLSRNGLPTGIQVVAAPFQDRNCLAVARELEKEFGGWVEPGRIS